MAPLFNNKDDEERKRLSQDMQNLSEQIGQLKRELLERNSEIERMKKEADQAKVQGSAAANVNAQALKNAQSRIAELQKKLTQAQSSQQADASANELKDAQARMHELQGKIADMEAGAHPPTDAAQPAAPAAAAGLQIGGSAYVAQAGGMPLRLRSRPGLAKDTILDRLPPGTKMTLLEGPQPRDGYTWWHIRTADGREGWVAGEDLRSQPE